MNGGIKNAFKTDLIRDRSLSMHPIMFMIMGDMIQWASMRDLRVSITETMTTKEEDKALNRVSDSHSTGRAFDMSTRSWPEDKIKEFMLAFSQKYSDYAALSQAGSKSLIVRHDTGHGDHFHVQINRAYTVLDMKGNEYS